MIAMPPGAFTKGLLWLTLALGSIALIEPAPYDVLLVILLGVGIITRRFRFSAAVATPVALLGAFIFANVLSAFAASDPKAAVSFFAITLYLVVSWGVFAGLVGRYRDQALALIFRGYTVAGVFAATTGIGAYLGVIPYAEMFIRHNRVAGLFKDPNVYGPFLVPAALFCLLELERQKGIRRLAWASGFGTLLMAIFLSFSRAAWGNLVLAMAVYLGFPGTVSLRKRLVATVSVLLIGGSAILYSLTFPQIKEIFTYRLGFMAYDEDRFAVQMHAVEVGKDAVLGLGPGQAEVVFNYATHSLFVRVWAENGWLGFVVFVLFVCLSIGRSFRMAGWYHGIDRGFMVIVLGAQLGVLFNSFFIDSLHWRHFWLLFALPWMPRPMPVEKDCAPTSDGAYKLS